jgi:hypothetical protein
MIDDNDYDDDDECRVVGGMKISRRTEVLGENYTQVLCQYRLCRVDHASLTYLMLQRQLNHLNCSKLDHGQV